MHSIGCDTPASDHFVHQARRVQTSCLLQQLTLHRHDSARRSSPDDLDDPAGLVALREALASARTGPADGEGPGVALDGAAERAETGYEFFAGEREASRAMRLRPAAHVRLATTNAAATTSASGSAYDSYESSVIDADCARASRSVARVVGSSAALNGNVDGMTLSIARLAI
ncbi:MAG: hypothetical protein ACHREM_15955 [Polyangiales bacterium]